MVIGAQGIRLSNGLTTRSAHLRDIENDEAEARSSHDRGGAICGQGKHLGLQLNIQGGNRVLTYRVHEKSATCDGEGAL